MRDHHMEIPHPPLKLLMRGWKGHELGRSALQWAGISPFPVFSSSSLTQDMMMSVSSGCSLNSH